MGWNVFKCAYLYAVRCMTFWAQKECAIDEWIAVKNKHRIFAQNAIDATLVMLCQRRQNKQTCLIIAMVTFVFHLQ